MSQAIALEAKYENGVVRVTLQSATTLGTVATMTQCFPQGIKSVPNDNQWAEIFINSLTQQTVVGIVDNNTNEIDGLDKGEIVLYSNNWRTYSKNSGISMHKVGTNSSEHAMMGESTNKLIADLQQQIIDLTTWLKTLQTAFNLHVHTGVSTGIGSSGTPTPFPTPVPDDTAIIQDKAYTIANKNLASDDYEAKK